MPDLRDITRFSYAPDIRRLVVARGAFLVFYRVRADIEVLHIRRSERMPVAAHELVHFSDDEK